VSNRQLCIWFLSQSTHGYLFQSTIFNPLTLKCFCDNSFTESTTKYMCSFCLSVNSLFLSRKLSIYTYSFLCLDKRHSFGIYHHKCFVNSREISCQVLHAHTTEVLRKASLLLILKGNAQLEIVLLLPCEIDCRFSANSAWHVRIK